jgi:hypothetical protein
MEDFFTDYQNTFSALGAIGALSAVIVSLWLAFRQSKPKIKIFIQKGLYISEIHDNRLKDAYKKALLIKDSESRFEKDYYEKNKKEGKEYLVATVTNIGYVPVKLFSHSFLFSSWQFSCGKPFFVREIRKLYDLGGIQKYPCVIDVAETTEIILEDLNSFREFLSDFKSGYLWSFNVSNGWVNFKPKISKPLLKEVKKHLRSKK